MCVCVCARHGNNELGVWLFTISKLYEAYSNDERCSKCKFSSFIVTAVSLVIIFSSNMALVSLTVAAGHHLGTNEQAVRFGFFGAENGGAVAQRCFRFCSLSSFHFHGNYSNPAIINNATNKKKPIFNEASLLYLAFLRSCMCCVCNTFHTWTHGHAFPCLLYQPRLHSAAWKCIYLYWILAVKFI